MSPVKPPRTDGGRLLLVLALAAAVTLFTATVPLLRDWFDLRVYYGTIDTWVHHGGRIYDYRVPGTTYGFTYPPFAAVSMLPMAHLGLRAAIAATLLLNLAALGAVMWMTAGPLLRRYGWYGCALAACALALFEPVRDTISFGQVNLVLLALVLTDAWLLTTGRTRWVGIGIGLAAAIKLTPALFIGLLLLAAGGGPPGSRQPSPPRPPRSRRGSRRTPRASTGARRCGTPSASADSRTSRTSRSRECWRGWPHRANRAVPCGWSWSWSSWPSGRGGLAGRSRWGTGRPRSPSPG